MDTSAKEASSGSASQTDAELAAAKPDGLSASSTFEATKAQAALEHPHDDPCTGPTRYTGDNEEEASSGEDPDQWMPGKVHYILLGGSESQAMVEEAHDMGLKLVVVLWLAAWSAAANDAAAALEEVAADHSHIMFLCLDVEASEDNTSFAFEKVMAAATSQRKGAKPVPRSGHKWPVLTLHGPPNLHVERSFAGAAALASLREHLQSEGGAYAPEPPEEGGHSGEAEARPSAQDPP